MRLEQQAELEQANHTNALQNTIGQAKALEYDETKHQAMIRFLAEVLRFSHVVSSALLAFFLILTFKVCFHYLGAMRQGIQRSILIATGQISANIEQFKLAHPAPVKVRESLPSPKLQLPVKSTGMNDNIEKSNVYAQAELAKVGALVSCPHCGAAFQKSNKWHLFCSNNRKPRADGGNCSDDWHNAQKPDRSALMQERKEKG